MKALMILWTSLAMFVEEMMISRDYLSANTVSMLTATLIVIID